MRISFSLIIFSMVALLVIVQAATEEKIGSSSDENQSILEYTLTEEEGANWILLERRTHTVELRIHSAILLVMVLILGFLLKLASVNMGLSKW